MKKTANQNLYEDAPRHRILTIKYANGVAKMVVAAFAARSKEIGKALAAALYGIDSAHWTAKQRQEVYNELYPVLFDIYTESLSAYNDQIPEFVQSEIDHNIRLLSKVIPAEITRLAPVGSPKPSEVISNVRKMAVQGSSLNQLPKAMAQSSSRNMVTKAAAMALQGQTKSQIVDELTPKNSAFYNNQVSALNTVVKTHIGATGTAVRNDFIEENRHLLKARQWVSTLDSHTTKLCIVRDMKLYTLDDSPKPIGHDIPYGAGPAFLHYNCRSVETLVLKSASEILPNGEFSGQTRASMNGQVASGVNYQQWLAGQSDYIKEKVLGVMRADMVRRGKLTIPELFSDNGDFISINDLKKMDAAAFA